MIRLAVIGCGAIAQYHLRALQDNRKVHVVALADLRSEVARKTADAFSIGRWTGDPNELLEDPAIDAVILALPTQARLGLALAAFRSGKHVLVEKPVAMNAGEVAQLIGAQGNRVGACCSSRNRALGSAQAAAQFLRDGALGQLRVLRVRSFTKPGPAPATQPPEWRLSRRLNGGGIFVNWGCYDLDYMMGLLEFRLQPLHVLARTWTVPAAYEGQVFPGSDGETHAVALVTFTNGAVLVYERSEFAAIPPDAAWQITGERGTLSLSMQKSKSSRVELTVPAPEGIQTKVLWEGDESSVDEVGSPASDFVEAIATGRKPRTTLGEALIVAKITDAVYQSARSGAPARVT